MSKHKRYSRENRSRRNQFVEGPSRPAVSWNVVILAAVGVFLGVVILIASRDSSSAAAPMGATVGTGADLTVESSSLADGRARFFTYRTRANRDVRVFLMRSSDGEIRAALDACTVCYQKGRGYRQAGDNMLCNECGKSFRSVDINVITGGCNPIPLERDVNGSQVVVRATALEQGAAYF